MVNVVGMGWRYAHTQYGFISVKERSFKMTAEVQEGERGKAGYARYAQVYFIG